MDTIYRTLSPEAIPWNMAEPPEVLVHLVESGTILPSKAIDLGCGAGNYAIYLASRGFQVTGVDISPAAIRMAEENAKIRGIPVTFLAGDLLGNVGWIGDTFDFAYDWELLHHIMPGDRERYVRNVHSLLNPGGKYLSVCFSESDPQFGGKGKVRRTQIGTVLYFSSEDELRELFSPLFVIRALKTIEVAGKYAPHRAVCAFLEKQ